MKEVYLLLGGNVGDVKSSFLKAINLISNKIGAVEAASTIHTTKAWGNTNQPDFLNQALKIRTSMPPLDLLNTILSIEVELGRVREVKWGPRIIDIDILFYGSEIINEENLKIPHPHLHERAFALNPLAEIAADFIHPSFKKSVKQLLLELE